MYRGAFKRKEHMVLTVLLAFFLALFASACQENKKDVLPAGTEGISLISLGIMQGNMAPFERHYSRGRVRHFGDPARVAAVVDRLVADAKSRGRHPIVVDLGDNLSGSAEALFTKGAITARVLGDLPLNATLMGNLEFAHGQKVLEEYHKKLGVPFIASNITKEDGSDVPFAKRFINVTAGKIKVTLAGLVPPNLKFVCLPGNVDGLKVIEGIAEPFKQAGKAKIKNSSHLLIMLTQESLGKQLPGFKEALKGSGIDILFGLDFDREGEIKIVEGARVLAFPGHNQGQRIRVTELDVHEAKGIVKVDSWFEMVDADVEKPKASVNAYLDEARKKYKAALDKEIGRVQKYCNRNFWTDGDTGNILTDALRKKTGADIAVVNSGGVSSALAPGAVLLRDLYRVIPYQNSIAVLEVKGKDLIKFLHETLGRGSPVQVSGLFLRLSRMEDTRGFRVVHALHKGQDIVPDKTYKMVTNDFVLGRSPQLVPVKEITTGPLMREVLAEYFKKHSPVPRPKRGRVVIEGE